MTPGNVQYRITRILGEGAFGTVYEGERVGEGLSRRVAMKLLHTAHTGRAGIEGRLRDEARMLSLIQHRAIVRVDDLIRVDDAWCVVMEYVGGADLGALLEVGPFSPRAALEIAEEVASALHAAYTQQGPEGKPLRLVHRDIKPENIRVTPRGDVKLLDFGIARAEFKAREVHTQTPGMGTIVYMSAERFNGEDTHAGDVYALGVTLFELLTGVPPGSSAGDFDRSPPGRKLRAQWAWLGQLDAGLLSLVTAMLSADPVLRPTARECARTLSELRMRVPGERLEDWAEAMLASPDGTLEERASTSTAPEPPPELPFRRRSRAPRASSTMLQVGQTVGGILGGSVLEDPTLMLDADPPGPTMVVPMVTVSPGSPRAPVLGGLPKRAAPGLFVGASSRKQLLPAVGLAAMAVGLAVVGGLGGAVWLGARMLGDDPPAVSLRGAPARVAPVPTSAVASAPAPVASSAPAPVASSAPAPVASSAPAPVASSAPAPVASSAPAPVAPASRAATSAGAPAVTEPVSRASPPTARPTAPRATAVAPPETSVVETPKPAEEVGRLVVSAPRVRVKVRGANGAIQAGSVPPGTYTVEATFPDGSAVAPFTLVVNAGKTTTVTCDPDFGECSTR